MRVLVTGQVGLDKGDYLAEVKAIGRNQGKTVHILSTGEKMIEAYQGKIDEKTILNLPKVLLDLLRRYVWRDVLSDVKRQDQADVVIVNSHAVFRWHHGLFPAIDLDLVMDFKPDVVVTLIADVDEIKTGLQSRGTDFFELWELLAWREEEIWLTKFLTESLRKLTQARNGPKFYLLPKKQGPDLLYRLLTEPETPKTYISFPMTGLAEEKKREVESFKGKILKKFIGFDPASLSERDIVIVANSLLSEIREAFEPMGAFFGPNRTASRSKSATLTD